MGFPDGYSEMNPYMRDNMGHFVLWKGIVVKLMIMAGLAIISAVLYWIVARAAGARWGVVFAVILPLYTAFEAGEAALSNILLKLRIS